MPKLGMREVRRAQLIDDTLHCIDAAGLPGTTLASVAQRANISTGIVSHYFGDKSGLLVATMQLPVNPLERLMPVLAGGIDGMGPRLITAFLSAWDPHRDVFSALIRTTLGSGDPAATPVLQVVRNIVVTSLRDRMDGDDTELRATLVASQLVGMATLRYVARLEPVASAPGEQVARWYGPAIQELLTPSER